MVDEAVLPVHTFTQLIIPDVPMIYATGLVTLSVKANSVPGTESVPLMVNVPPRSPDPSPSIPSIEIFPDVPVLTNKFRLVFSFNVMLKVVPPLLL